MGEPIRRADFVSRLIHYGWDRAFLFCGVSGYLPYAGTPPGGRAKPNRNRSGFWGIQ